MKSLLRPPVLLTLVTLSTACGGGGGGEQPPPAVSRLDVVEPAGGTVSAVVGTTVGPVRVRALDAQGRAVSGIRIDWVPSAGTVSPASATTDAGGVATTTWTVGGTVGTQSLRAAAASGSPTVSVTASVTAAAPPPLTVSSFPTDTLRPGGSFSLAGTGFDAGTVAVSVGGSDGPVAVASGTRVNAGVPTGLARACTPPTSVRIVVRRQVGATVDSVVGSAPFDPAKAVTLQPGERVVADTTQGLWCTRLDAGGQYVVSLYNANTAVPGGVAAQLRGRSANPVIAQRTSDAVPTFRRSPRVPNAAVSRVSGSRADDAEIAAAAAHADHLERERTRLTRLGSPVPALARVRASRGVLPSPSVAAAPAVGDVLTLNAMYFDCATPTAVKARVAAVGSKSIVLEDVTSPGAGTRDTVYRALADEFDRVMYPIVTQNFGDPLALDAKFGGDGHVRILLTPYVTDSVPNTIGFMTGCNFYSRAQLPSSNEAAVFYARLPNSFESAAAWRQNLRATLIHETKHLAAYAERFARAGTATPVLEQLWLEEATARVAEELYARTFSGAAWKGNAAYAATVGCELTACDGRPIATYKHFSTLADYYARVDSLTPLGRVSPFDGTFYSSGWLLVRWAADRFAADEGAFFRALTTETTVTGIENVVQRTGRVANLMLADWSLALAVDDRPGFTPKLAELSIPSWNTRDVFRGLNAYNAFQFPKPFPLLERTASPGDFVVGVPLLRSFTAAFVELTVPSGARQLLSAEGAGGAALPLGVGMSIVRVQ